MKRLPERVGWVRGMLMGAVRVGKPFGIRWKQRVSIMEPSTHCDPIRRRVNMRRAMLVLVFMFCIGFVIACAAALRATIKHAKHS